MFRQLGGMPAKIQSLFSLQSSHFHLSDHSLPPLLTPQHPTISQFDPLTEFSISSSSLFLALLITLGLCSFCISANRFDKILHEDKHSEALTALMAIFTPTKSSWPSDILAATRRASVHSAGSSSSGRGEIRLGFSSVYKHILNGDLELQSTASVDLVKAMLLEREGVEVDGWKIKVVVEWKWVIRVSLWVVKGLGSRLRNLSELWNGDIQKVILVPATKCMRFILMVVYRLRTYWVRRLLPSTHLTYTSLNSDLNRAHESSFLPPDLRPRFTSYISTRPILSTVVQDVTFWPPVSAWSEWKRGRRKTRNRDILYDLGTLSSPLNCHVMRVAFLPPRASWRTHPYFA